MIMNNYKARIINSKSLYKPRKISVRAKYEPRMLKHLTRAPHEPRVGNFASTSLGYETPPRIRVVSEPRGFVV